MVEDLGLNEAAHLGALKSQMHRFAQHDILAGGLYQIHEVTLPAAESESLLAGAESGSLSDAVLSSSWMVSGAGCWPAPARLVNRSCGNRSTAWRSAWSQRTRIFSRSGSWSLKRRWRVMSNSSVE